MDVSAFVRSALRCPSRYSRTRCPHRKIRFQGDLAEGTRLGPWRLLHLIGRGGAGEVYYAERADGVFQQKAAVKVLQRGAVAEVTRFQVEREILARLEHPGIARLLDGGMHSDGRPYMVMEYVEGMSLTEYCETRQLDLRARLRLYIEVCDVVAYAHRNLVVHRDLKPRNILITQEGRVKLLDFGVAKLLDAVAGPAFEKTSAPLTPDYAAPEQLTGQPITTATDIYALGVVLFELLTTRKPFRNTDVPVAHAVRAVLHEAPPTPSKAARLMPNAFVPHKMLEGDLDAIVAKCLRKEAEHRYDERRHARGRHPSISGFGARLCPRRRADVCARQILATPSLVRRSSRHGRRGTYRGACRRVVASAYPRRRARYRKARGIA